MKKLLSIVLCTFFSVSMAVAATDYKYDKGTTTINVYPSNSDGGTVEVCVETADSYNYYRQAWSWKDPKCDDSSSSGQSRYHKQTQWLLLGTVTVFEETTGVRYTLKATENTTDGFTFEGWAKDSPTAGVYNANREFTEIATYLESNNNSMDFYAIFTYYSYLNRASAEVIGANSEVVPGWVYVDGGETEYKNIDNLMTEGWDVIKSYGDNSVKHNPNPVYYYHAKPNTGVEDDPTDDYTFIGWFRDPSGLGDPVSTDKTYVWEVSLDKNPTAPVTIPTLYAKFAKDKYYFFQEASASVAGEEDGGNIRIKYSESENPEWSKVVNPSNVAKYQKNNAELRVIYEAQNLDESRYAFVGWGTSASATPADDMKSLTISKVYEASEENTESASPVEILPLYAIFASYYYYQPSVLVATASRDAGKVFVSLNEATLSENDPRWSDGMPASDVLNQKPAVGASYEYHVHYYAQPNVGAEFRGWSTTPDGKNIISEDEHYIRAYQSTNKSQSNPHVAAPLYAVFASYIDIQQQDRMICYVDYQGERSINDARIIVELLNANTLTAELTDLYAENQYFMLANNKSTQIGNKITYDATQGLMALRLSYTGDLQDAVGRTAYITLTGKTGENVIVQRTISVVVEEAPVITFLPTDGKGDYDVSLTDGSGVYYQMDRTSTENISVQVTHENMSNIEMKLTSPTTNGDFIFFGWKKTEGDVDTYISYEPTCVHEFSQAAVVQAEFIHKDVATFIIKGQSQTYHDLQQALSDAQILKVSTGSDQVVVFANLFANTTPEAQKEGILRRGVYTIPAGVTLLIPAEDTYREIVGDLANYYNKTQGSGTFGCYRKLVVEAQTQFIVHGNISLAVNTIYTDGTYNSIPGIYGQMELGDNCTISLENGAALYAPGYLTGLNTSKVIANAGSNVYELLQYTDYHGGSGTAALYQRRDEIKVFPLSQYYIQNIEVPLEMKYGSQEWLSTSASMNGDVTAISTEFIVSNTTEGRGFFQIGEGSSVIKQYDPEKDRQKFTVRGGSSTLGYMLIDMGWVIMMDVVLNSSDYVLPINNNMDISLESATLTTKYDIAFLAGSSLTVDKNSIVNINSKVYVYDADERRNNVDDELRGEGYFGHPRFILSPLLYTPNSSHKIGTNYKRIPDQLQDARWLVNGRVNVQGGLYTTNGGAEIVSDGGGQIQFSSTLNATITNQAQYKGGNTTDLLLAPETFHHIVRFPVTSAKLQNAALDPSDKYTSTEYGTFIYNAAKGKWEKAPISDTWSIPVISVTQPNQTKKVDAISYITGVTSEANISNIQVTIDDDHFTLGDLTFSAERGGMVIPITYLARNIAGEYVARLSILYDGTTYTQLVTAVEDYTPQFNVLPSSLLANVGVPFEVQPFIAPIAENVTELVTDPKMTWDATISGDAANQYQMLFGENANKLLESKLIFEPTSEGVKYATLHLTATYTDAASVAHSTTMAIPLAGVAYGLAENDLAFADLSSLYMGLSSPVRLFQGDGSGEDIEIAILDGSGNAVTLDELGVVDSDLNSTIQPKKIGTYTINVTQSASANVEAARISKTITIYPRVKWNWENLYYGNTYTDPITILGGKTDEWTLTKTSDIKDVIIYDADNKSAKVRAWDSGEAEVQFTFSQQGQDDIIFTTLVHRDPRKVRVDVNDLRTFKAVNAGTQGVKFDELKKTISFTSPAGEISQWVMNFIGVPDELCFTPTQGGNAWQIEESLNGINWTTSYTWAAIENNTPFSLSLSPTTQFIRISYGSARVQNVAVLDKLYVTALQSVKSDVDQLYMPIVEPSSTKDLVLTYASIDEALTLSTSSDKFTLSDYTLGATTEENPYYVKTVVVTSTAEDETPGAVYVKKGDKLLLDIPIYPYEYPQDLPILLETDPIQRYYFVTTKSYHTEWDEVYRTIVFDNAVSDAAPFVTFHFSDSPTPGLISFKSSANGTWRIEESANELDWVSYEVKKDANQMIVRTLNPTSRHIRLTYVSSYAEIAEVSNLSIVPTSTIMVDKTDVVVFKGQPVTVKVTANNLEAAPAITCSSDKFTISDIASSLVGAGTKEANLEISYIGDAAMESGSISFNAGENLLATIQVVGRLKTLSNGVTGIKTGLKNGYTMSNASEFEGTANEDVDISSAFAGTTPLFDYVFIFGETSTTDEQLNVTAPNNGSGSNAVTPCYVYKKAANGYEYYAYVENANTSSKIEHLIPTIGSQSSILDLYNESKEKLRVYVTGFCPYASTGYTKQHEGVFFFRGNAGDEFDVYLENCYLYSRYKTYDGHSFIDRSNGESFSENYVRGSGGVLVFECGTAGNGANPMEVTIHTSERNVLKSHYGCFFESIVGRAFQVSSPVQIHMAGAQVFVEGSYTILNFDDIWPVGAEVDVNGKYNNTVRTNGFLALKKQVNNAPSIDLGNPLTVVNFNGGRVELQNAQNVSDNYKTTMAISHRSGEFAGFLLAYGLGSDAAGGTVNFTDGTTTVQRMKVDERYSQYYLMDEDRIHTSCLRCPANTYITGGSHCMMRACSEPTSVGGAPRNKPATEDDSKLLGLYKYPKNPESGKKGGWELLQDGNGLVDPTSVTVPGGYSVNSVTPNTNGTVDASDDFLNFWFDPNFEPSVTPEVDKKLTFWKAAMTFIEASYAGFTRSIGGPTTIEQNGDVQTEAVTNLLYCQIDPNISDVIRNNYSAPVKNPTPSGGYEEIRPTTIGSEYENYVTNVAPYKIDNKVYYIATIPSADVWMTFTAPFNVEKIYVVEAFDESYLEDFANGEKKLILKEQARHNADFAAFFGVAMALGSDQPFDMIYKDYIGWAKIQDGGTTNREMKEIHHYYRLYDNDGKLTHNNWNEADFYLYKNTSNWTKEDDDTYNTNWDFVVQHPDTKVLLEKGSVYSMFFPYCVGCWDKNYERSFWDYWSGKFLVFESTAGGANGHEINGSNFVGTTILATKHTNSLNETSFTVNTTYTDDGGVYVVTPSSESDDLAMTGNATFAPMGTMKPNVYIYSPSADDESFDANLDDEQNPVSEPTIIKPTESFLIGKELTDPQTIKSISRSGKITYFDSNNGNQNGTTGGRIPTVGGGNDLFVTSIAGGINVAVAAPQNVRVLSSTGAVIYSGYVTTAVDIQLPTTGIYIVSGENEVQKILF